MIFYKKITLSVVTGLVIAGLFSSCQEDITTIGAGLVSGDPFETGKASFDIFAYNKKIEAVKSNGLPIYQLGNFNDPVYGKTVASITSQLQLSTVNPTFGIYSAVNEESNIDENETIKKVYLFIPYLTNVTDTDGDGVPDSLDIDPSDPNSDTDGDGISDNSERLVNTNPLSNDTDGDGILDGVDTENNKAAYARKFVLDSIYGANLAAPFNIKVSRSTYFLRDLDPATNFEQSQEFFSNNDFSSFTSDVLFDGQETIRDTEIVTYNEDDPDTEDVDESEQVAETIGAGIYIPLSNAFFQTNFLDKEGSIELQNAANFKNFIRGIHVTLGESDDFYMLLNLLGANITITYEYDSLDTNGTADDTSDDQIVQLEKQYVINLLTGGGVSNTGVSIPVVGNAVNTFINDAYPSEIQSALNSTTNAEKIYLKGGAGSYAEIKLFDEDLAASQNIISQIKANNWVINEANLVFYVDRQTLDATAGIIEPLRLYLFTADEYQPLYNPTTEYSVSGSNALTVYPFYNGVLTKENGKGVLYKIRITDYLNNLISGDFENVTLGLSVTSDIRFTTIGSAVVGGENTNLPVMNAINPFGTVLYGSATDGTNKLKLEISYTKVD